MLVLTHYVFGIIITFLSIYGYGNFFLRNKDYFITFLIGYIFIGSLSLLLHFFFPINIYISSIIIFTGLILFLLLKKSDNLIYYTIIIILFSLILVGKSEHPIDSNLYHHSYISYLQIEKIILGISNLHSRFGHISFLQFAQALYSNDFFNVYSLSNINILFYALFFIFLYRINFIEKKNNLTLILSILISSFLLIKLARYREYGNDLIPFIVASYFLIKIVDNFFNPKTKQDLLFFFPIFIYFMLTHKITYLFSSLIFLGLVNKQTLFSYLNKKKNIIILFLSAVITILWLFKNLLETSCLVYPVIQTCFNDLDWYSSGESNPASALINAEAWSKGWIDRPKNMNLSMTEFSQSFNWLEIWFSTHFIKILEIISPLILAIILIKIITFKEEEKTKKLSYENIKFKQFLVKLSILNLVGLFFWFLNAPIFRYGSFYIITLIILAFMIFNLKKINTSSIKYSKKLKYIFILSIFIFSYKNIERFEVSNELFFSKTRPSANLYNVVYNNEIKIIKPKKKLNICYYPKNICTHLNIENLKINKYGNYLIIKN